MTTSVLDIDHLMCGVASPQTAGEIFERLGFTVTPLSQMESMGLGNRCVLFQSATPGAANYLELMGIVASERVPEVMLQTLAGGDGVKSMVLATDDCDACHRVLQTAGFTPPTPPIHITRAWAFSPDDIVHPSFAVLLPMSAPLGFNVCQHKTLPLYLRPAWTTHPNGAFGLDSVIAYASNVDETSAFYERLFGRVATRDVDGLVAVRPGQVALRIGNAETIAAAFGAHHLTTDRSYGGPGYLGICIRVRSISALCAHLKLAEVPHVPISSRRAIVAARDACGNFIEFVE